MKSKLWKSLLVASSIFIFSLASAEEYVNGVRHDELEVIQIDGVAEPSKAPNNTARIFYNLTDDKLKLSVNGGAYSNIGAGGGASNYSDLLDVNLTGLGDGQLMKWNTTRSKWEVANDNVGAGASTYIFVQENATAKGDSSGANLTLNFKGAYWNVTVASQVANITLLNYNWTNWDTAYSWGNHINESTTVNNTASVNLTKTGNDITAATNSSDTGYYTTTKVRADVNATDPITLSTGTFGFNATLKANYDTAYNNFLNKTLANTTNDQNLNTTSNVTFNNVTAVNVVGNLPWANVTGVPGNTTQNQGVNTTDSPTFAGITNNISIQKIQVNQGANTYTNPKIQIINGTGATGTITNDTTNNQINITLAATGTSSYVNFTTNETSDINWTKNWTSNYLQSQTNVTVIGTGNSTIKMFGANNNTSTIQASNFTGNQTFNLPDYNGTPVVQVIFAGNTYSNAVIRLINGTTTFFVVTNSTSGLNITLSP
jgi:hypothetical protein